MKKIVTILLAIVCVVSLCSCKEKTIEQPETIEITYNDLYEANSFSSVTSNHKTIYLIDGELRDGEFEECEYYWNESTFAFSSYPYVDDNGNTVQDARYITNEGLFIELHPITSENATLDLFACFVEMGFSTPESICKFGLISPEYNQTITECKKTDEGYEITGENKDEQYVAWYYSTYLTDGEYAQGDKIIFKNTLNENYEVLEFEEYYVFADGKESIKVLEGEYIYDSKDTPDFVEKINAVVEKGPKDTVVNVYTEKEVFERIAYSDTFLLSTDYEVYSDAEYTDLLTSENGYYVFDTANDISIYLKAPVAK